MQITDEMVDAAFEVFASKTIWNRKAVRDALEAALGVCETDLKRLNAAWENEALITRDQRACIEDLAGALKEISSLADVDADNRSTIARSVLEQWGLK